MTTTTQTETAVDRFLAAIASGAGIDAALYAPDAVLDATVPEWRFTVRGADAIAREYSRWFDNPGTFEELERLPVEGGEVVSYLLTWIERGVPHAAHHCHRLVIDHQARIAADRCFCGGRWDATRLAEMAAADQAG